LLTPIFICVLAFTATAAVLSQSLPRGLYSPGRGVVCDSARGICFDKYGPSIGLTEVYLGKKAADTLTSLLRGRRPDSVFHPLTGIDCVGGKGPCTVNGEIDSNLSSLLYVQSSLPETLGAEAAAAMNVEWKWLVSRYTNKPESRPADSSHYTLLLLPSGVVKLRNDCNRAGGSYRMRDSSLTILISSSTMASCPSGSLDGVFLRDLAAVVSFYLKDGNLFLDLKSGSGTMKFGK
jgi:heat shock protein HslJ